MARLPVAVAALLLAAFAGTSVAQIGSGETTVRLVSADFAPEDGKTYDLKWPGPPHRAWREDDKRYYTLTARLSAPAQEDFSFAFLVKENKTWDLDPVMASVIVSFAKGDIEVQGRFWLVCNRDGRIQGNLGREFDGYGNLYLKANAPVTDLTLDTWKLAVSAPKIPHSVQCK